MKRTNIITLITLVQTFIMGAIDAFTFQNYDGSFVSAQTGNLVLFGYELIRDGWTTASLRIPVLIGFLLGAFLSQPLTNDDIHLKSQTKTNLLISITILTITLILLIVNVDRLLILFILGGFSGFELTAFSTIGKTKVNNGIMTGNLKNFANNLYETIFNHDNNAKIATINFALGILFFVMGVVASAQWLSARAILLFPILIIFNSGLVILAIFFKKEVDTYQK
ncbi:YoaK family protein [Lentilactobacillus sp. Marseille-Q4993]|uniref:YoaK family protein n=1 Tax=Lentilactobacillus sp. Marseille-Q4993 TaxID=3039492 RepID=UPI0024BC5C9A|nr:YoaK family protein [Lentilactobacillus sp. Marseille-Q4993]